MPLDTGSSDLWLVDNFAPGGKEETVRFDSNGKSQPIFLRQGRKRYELGDVYIDALSASTQFKLESVPSWEWAFDDRKWSGLDKISDGLTYAFTVAEGDTYVFEESKWEKVSGIIRFKASPTVPTGKILMKLYMKRYVSFDGGVFQEIDRG